MGEGNIVFPSNVAPPPATSPAPARSAPRKPPASAKPARSVAKKPPTATPAKKTPKTITLKPWRVNFKLGYLFGVPTPISAESHGIQAEASFRFNQHPFGYTLGLNFTQEWTKYRVSATDWDTRVTGSYRSFNLVLGREKLKSSWLSMTTSNLLGFSQHAIPSETITMRGDTFDVPGSKATGFSIATRYELNARAADWITFGGNFMLGATDAKGTAFDRMLLNIGFFAKLSFGPKAREVETKKGKPSWLAFSHSLAGITLGLVQRYYTNGLNDANERMLNAGLVSGADEPGALANLVILKLATTGFGMLGQGTAMGTYFSMEDWRSWGIAGAVGLGGLGYLFTGTAGKTTGIADIANVIRMIAFKDVRTTSQRKALTDKQKAVKTRNALLISGAVNFGAGFIFAIPLAMGKYSGFAQAGLHGSTIAQGGTTFLSVPGMKNAFTIAYSPAIYYWSKDGKGWLGGVILKKTFKGTKVGVETTLATSMLNGKNIYAEMNPGEPFNGTLLPSFACAAMGYATGGTNWDFFVGPRQCLRQGGSDLKVGSIGAQVSLWGKIPFKKWALVGGLSLGADWNVGRIGSGSSDDETSSKDNNSFSLTIAPAVGVQF